MIEDISGCIDYDESGAGPTVVLVPGSCSTGAAWRPVMAQWKTRFRVVTTSLLGYGAAIAGAAHFMIATHAADVAGMITQRVACAEDGAVAPTM